MSEAYNAVPLSPLRKIIAARMVNAKQTIPHYRISVDIEVDAMLALRQQINADQPDNKISVNDFIIKACANALMAHPEINCQLIDDEIHQYKQADIAVVVAVEGGLSTPIIFAANDKTLQDISREAKSLAIRAASGQLKTREILGGTFSISNLGGYDVDQFDAIINPPQCAILAVGSAKPKPVVKGEAIRSAMVMRVSLSLDHRAIDGAVGAKYLSCLREQLQTPEGLVS